MPFVDKDGNVIVSGGAAVRAKPANSTLARGRNAPKGTLDGAVSQPDGQGNGIVVLGTVTITENQFDGTAIHVYSENFATAMDNDRAPAHSEYHLDTATGEIAFQVRTTTLASGEDMFVRIAGLIDNGDGTWQEGPPRETVPAFLTVDEAQTVTVNTYPTMYSNGAATSVLRAGLEVAFTTPDVDGDEPQLRVIYGQVSDDGFTSNIVRYDAGDTMSADHVGWIPRVVVVTTDSLGNQETHTGSTQSAVTAAPTPGTVPPALTESDWTMGDMAHPTQGVNVIYADITGASPTRVYGTASNPAEGAPPGSGWQTYTKHSDTVTYPNRWLRDGNQNGEWKSWLEISPGATEGQILRYTTDDTGTTTAADADYSADSDRKTHTRETSGEGGGEDPPPVSGSAGSSNLVMREHEEFAELWPEGDGMQQQVSSTQCLKYPNVIGHGQDMGGFWLTIDGGRTRITPRRLGMHSIHGFGIAVDPFQPRRWLCYAPTVDAYSDLLSGGMFCSSDWMDTFEQAVTYNSTVAEDGHQQLNAVCFMPHTKTGSGEDEYCTTAYGIIAFGGGHSGSMPMHRFTWDANGFVSSTQVGTVSKGTVGNINEMVGHPTRNEIWLSTSEGVFKMTNPGSASGISKLSGSNGLTGGAVRSKVVFASDDPDEIIVGVSGNGSYRTVNDGGNWARSGGQQSRLHKLFVNPRNTNYQFYSTPDKSSGENNSDQHPRFTTNRWGNVIEPSNNAVESRPGFGGGRDSMNMCYQHCHGFYTSTTNDAELFFMGCHKSRGQAQSDWRSTDGGTTLNLAVSGFSGVKGQAFHSPCIFDIADRDTFFMPGLDGGGDYTEDGGQSWFNVPFSRSQLGTLHSTCNGATLVRDGSGNHRLCVSVGRAAKGRLVIYNFSGGTFHTPFAATGERLQGLCYDFDDPSYVCGGKYENSNYGHQSNWSTISGNNWPGGDFVIGGCSLYHPNGGNGQAFIAVAYTGSNSEKGQVYRRLTKNGNWSQVLNIGHPIVSPQGWPLRVHPRNRDILYVPSQDNRSIEEWSMSSGNRIRTLDFGIPSSENLVFVKCFAVDPRFPAHKYLALETPGTAYGLMMTPDDGDTWVNLTSYVSNMNPSLLEIHPLTGNVFYGSGNGFDILSPQYTEPLDLRGTKNFRASNRVDADSIEAAWAS